MLAGANDVDITASRTSRSKATVAPRVTPGTLQRVKRIPNVRQYQLDYDTLTETDALAFIMNADAKPGDGPDALGCKFIQIHSVLVL